LPPIHPKPSASNRYTVQFDPAHQRIGVSACFANGERTCTFSLQPASHSDKALLSGALAQTFLALGEQAIQIQLLQEQLAVANKQLFGPSSEKKPIPSVEDPAPTGDAATADGKAETATPADSNVLPFKRPAGRKRLPPQLPRIRQEHRLPPDGCCPQCDAQASLRLLPPEVTEQMIVVPAQYQVVEHVRNKGVCRHCGTFVAAPMPKQMVEGSSYGSPSFLAYIACNKYQLGLPYYRQEKLFRQSHVPFNRTTMANLMNTCTDRLVALWLLLKEELLSQSIVHADETTLQVLKEALRSAETDSFMWLYCSALHANHPVILFDYQETRAGCHPREFLAGFTGYLHTDGYAGYDGVKGVTRLGCMAHMRRGFVKALDAIPKEQRSQALAAWPVGKIAVLYRIEKKFIYATPEQRQQARQQFSLPVMNEIKAWLDEFKPKTLPKSLLGKAITYALNQWDSLMVYLNHGWLAIDNNIAERAIKDLVIGRKSWLFADQPEGARTIAVMHSLVQTAVANNLDPYRYLCHVFEVMPTLKTSEELKQLLPWNVVLGDQDAPAELAA